MIVNPNKFQAMIMSCDKKEDKYDLNINNSIIISVWLLGIEIDSKLNFESALQLLFHFIYFCQGNIVYCKYICIL